MRGVPALTGSPLAPGGGSIAHTPRMPLVFIREKRRSSLSLVETEPVSRSRCDGTLTSPDITRHRATASIVLDRCFGLRRPRVIRGTYGYVYRHGVSLSHARARRVAANVRVAHEFQLALPPKGSTSAWLIRKLRGASVCTTIVPCLRAAGSRRRFARLGCSNRAGATRGTVSLHIEPPSKVALSREAAARGGVRTRC